MSVPGREAEDRAKACSWLIRSSSPPAQSPEPSPASQLDRGSTPDPFTMPLVVRGPHLLLCLLLLLEPHSSERDHPPLRRFEYKFSFKGPRLALPGAGIPFWSIHGDAIPGPEEVHVAPSLPNRSGAMWSRAPVPFSAWEVKVQIRVTGPGHRGARGMGVWYTRARGQGDSGLGGLASWDGVGILFDSSAENTPDSPAVRVLASDGHSPAQAPGDAARQVLGSCHRDFRNRPYPCRARITYWGQRLRVFLSSGLTPSEPEELCVNVGPLLLAPGGFFGVSAATSTLADDHDVLSFLTFSLTEPGPEASPRPLLEKEQLRLASQLEGLRARLALGPTEDSIPKLHSEAREGGDSVFDLMEALGRNSQILQALHSISEQLVQAERKWKRQLGSPDQIRPGEVWDSAKVSTLLLGQQTLLRDLQEMRDAAAHTASRAHVFYLPVGTKHHFLELTQILNHLQKELRGPVVGVEGLPRGLGGLKERAQPPFSSSVMLGRARHALPPPRPRSPGRSAVCLCARRGTDLVFSLHPHGLSVPEGRALGMTWSKASTEQKGNGSGSCPRAFKTLTKPGLRIPFFPVVPQQALNNTLSFALCFSHLSTLWFPDDPRPQAFPAAPTDGATGTGMQEAARDFVSSPSALDESQEAPNLGRGNSCGRGSESRSSSSLGKKLAYGLRLCPFRKRRPRTPNHHAGSQGPPRACSLASSSSSCSSRLQACSATRQDPDWSLRDYLASCRLPLSSPPQTPRAPGALRRQPFSSSLCA
ncbi:Protein ERGIC-53-like [Galemys pyrenaicus]|uniref:Protein ERGIC-53-like n=1 Tax=Galemys pyrenaicus TaxID=202257 RepID=A0A8J6A3E0_GALPY|nr:Protein ERGIC-53-like [Galemys pyrenaicus]